MDKELNFYCIVFLIFALLLSLLLVQKAKGEDVYLLGYRLIYIDSGSMEPTLRQGSIYLEKKLTDKDVLQIGDIVTYSHSGGSRITHRIVEINEDRILCQGDALTSTDGYTVARAEIQARIVFKGGNT